MRRASADGRLQPIARGLSVAALTIAYMYVVGGEIPVYEDTTQDMLRARDGAELGIFEGGSRTTFEPIGQAELWIRFLALTFGLGLGPVGQRWIMTVLAAISVAFFDRGVRRYFGAGVGGAAVAIFLPVTLISIVYPIATAGYLAPLVLVAATLALLRLVSTGSTASAGLSGASLALAAELHPVTLLGAPVFVLGAAMSCARPARAVLLGAMSAIATALVLSFHAWTKNAMSLLGEPWLLVLVVAAVAVALLIAARARPRWRSLGIDVRRRWLLVGIVGGIAVELAAASAITGRILLMPHYFMFAFPAAAVLAALALRRWRRRGGLARVVAIVTPVALVSAHLVVAAVWKLGLSTGTVAVPGYTMNEAKILARHLWEHGYTFPDVQRHLRGPQALELVGALAVYAPSADGPLERPMPDLRVFAFDEDHRPPGAMPSPCEEIDLGNERRAWILPFDGWVRLVPSRVCFGTSAEGRRDCVDIASSSIAYTGRYRDLYERVLPALGAVRDRIDGPAAEPFVWELPIEVTGDDRERHFDLVGLTGVPWRVERVEGVNHRGDLPARHVVLERGGGRSGRIVLAAPRSGMTPKAYPPDFLETRPDEVGLRRSLRELPPLGPWVCEAQGTCPDRATR